MDDQNSNYRVGAYLGVSGDQKVVEFLGYGIMLGEEVPPPVAQGGPIGQTANIVRETQSTNPKIQLDSGETVWGCECWWGTEQAIRTELENYQKTGFTITNVSINAFRADYLHQVQEAIKNSHIVANLIVAAVDDEGRIIRKSEIPVISLDDATTAPTTISQLSITPIQAVVLQAANTVRSWLGNPDQDSA